MKIFNFLLLITAFSFVSCSSSTPDYWDDVDEGGEEPPVTIQEKPRYIWVDAAANFMDFANSKENIARDLALAKDAGFTDIVVDVRPNTGDVLFKTTQVQEVEYLYAWVNGNYTKVERTATWDYLQAFIDEAHRLDLKIHAGINTFVGGSTINGGTGMLYRDQSKKAWATQMNTAAGIVSIMNTGESTKFLNPVNDKVQNFLCLMLKDLAKYDLDGIILDRGRFLSLQSDFSTETRTKFQTYIGNVTLTNYPADILAPNSKSLPKTFPTYLSKWLEFRVKTIHDFMQKARDAVKGVNTSIKFGVYVGGWYSSYYDSGVNWASKKYKTAIYYNWASNNYKDYGYADLMDQMIIGAYASPSKVRGTTEWTMEGFCSLAMDKIKGDCPLVVGGPDVGNWDYNNLFTQEQENQAIVQSVKACMDACDGYFLFDMIHLKLANQWQYAKEGIRIAVN
ncbi:MAG: alpha amylase family protein [Bacteroidaceae bacterium]